MLSKMHYEKIIHNQACVHLKILKYVIPEIDPEIESYLWFL